MHSQLLRAAFHYAAIFTIQIAIGMLIPAFADFYHGSPNWQNFIFSAAFTGGFALAVALASHGPPPVLTPRFGFLLTGLLWITTCLAGAVPFLGSGLDITDGIFESVSAVTTTGATVLVGLDELPPGILLWRSMLQWMGGVGVIVLGLLVLPLLHAGGIARFHFDTSGVGEQPFARLSSFGIGILSIYALLTLACAIAYAMAGMEPFDALNHALTTVSTGGLSTHDESFAAFYGQHAILWVAILFMFIGALPFSLLILLALRGRFDLLRDPQIRVFAAYTGLFIALAAASLYLVEGLGGGAAITLAAFNFMSLVTTTGFVAADHTAWGPLIVGLAFVAMSLGGCSGSTSGGIKTYRIIILFGIVRNGLRRLVYPNSVETIQYGDQPVGAELERAVVLFLGTFLFLWMSCMILLAATGLDFVSALSGSLSALMNVGVGLGDMIGPAGNHAGLSDAAKWILAFAMLLGRLEILPVLVLLLPLFWLR